MRASTALVALAAAVASAQTTPMHNYTSSLDMKIDPNTVKPGDRAIWCRGQTDSCGLLCDKNTNKNSCTQETLTYECTCASNNSSPALQYYTQTIPTFICQTLFSQCNTQYVGNADGQLACINDIQNLCGKTAPPTTSSSSSGGGSDSSDSGDSSSNTATTASHPSATQKGNSNSATSSSKGFAGPTLAPSGPGAAIAIGALALLL